MPGNALLGQPAAVAPQRAAPVGISAQQHVGMALANHHAFPAQELDRRMGHAAKSHRVATALLGKADLTSLDVMRALLNAADDGAVTHTQALDLASKMPTDPAGLRGFLAYLQEAAATTHGAISAEKSRRSLAGQRGT